MSAHDPLRNERASLWECRRAVFRYTLDEWHRGVNVTVSDPHWEGYEPVSVLSERPSDGGMVDVTVWFRRRQNVAPSTARDE